MLFIIKSEVTIAIHIHDLLFMCLVLTATTGDTWRYMHELQREERMVRIKRRMLQYNGSMSIGIQLDMWTDTETHTAFACISMTEVEEPSPGMNDPQLWLSSEILSFSVARAIRARRKSPDSCRHVSPVAHRRGVPAKLTPLAGAMDAARVGKRARDASRLSQSLQNAVCRRGAQRF